MKNDVHLLGRLLLFDGLHDTEIEKTLHCMEACYSEFPKGHYITLTEEDNACFGLIIQGTIHKIKENVWGDKSLFAVMEQGEIFGEGKLDESTYYDDIAYISATDSTVLFLPLSKFRNPCKEDCSTHRKLLLNFTQTVIRKNNWFMERLDTISHKTIRKKILAYLSLQKGSQEEKYFKITMGRIELANYLCVDRSALSRELARLKHEGILDYEGNTYRILVDIGKLP